MADQFGNHPLPTPPGQPQNFPQGQPQYNSASYQNAPPLTQTQTRRSRTFSFGSHNSHKSSGSKDKVELTETHFEKEAKRLHSKADPTLAMNEAEPSAVATTVKSSLASLRSMQHRDSFGNPITDPDLSNPTRSRWERPLDTIRSFEAAIDGGYNRKSYIRSDSESNWNRRNSFHPGNRVPDNHASRPQSMFRPESQYDVRQSTIWQQRESYFDPQNSNYNGGGPAPPPPQHGGRRPYPRMTSEPPVNSQRQDPSVYPISNNQRSYETVASASGSGTSGEPAGYQTDPTSSDNSSFERMHSQKREPEPVNDYGIGFSQNSSYQPSAFTVGRPSNPSGRPPHPLNNSVGAPPNYDVGPPVPQKGGMLRKPTAIANATPVERRPAEPEKRKSWLARRFSKNS